MSWTPERYLAAQAIFQTWPPPLSRKVFLQLFDEAMVDVMSSDGELTDITNRELLRIKTKPATTSSDMLKKAVTEAFCCLPTSMTTPHHFRKPSLPTQIGNTDLGIFANTDNIILENTNHRIFLDYLQLQVIGYLQILTIDIGRF